MTDKKSLEREAWKSFFRWFFALGITIFCFWEVTLQLLLSHHTPTLIYPFYCLVLIVSFILFGNLIGSLVVAFLATLLGVLAFAFLSFKEGLTLFFEINFIWLVIWGIVRFVIRHEKKVQREDMLLKDIEEKFNSLKIVHARDSLSLQSIKERIEKYKGLSRITKELSSSLDFKQISYCITTLSRQMIGKGDVRFLTGGEDLNGFEQWIFEKHSSLLVKDITEDFRFEKMYCPKSIKSMIGVPLIQEGKVLAILSLHSSDSQAFFEDDQRLLSIMADLFSIAWKNAQLFKEMQQLAITDGLTGLYVKGFFLERLNEEILRVKRFSTKLALLMLDIDDFKKCNDRYGHRNGDQVLSTLADIFLENTRQTDLVARYGGEEFAILMPRTSYSDACVVAEKIRLAVKNRKFAFNAKKVTVTISIGVASYAKGMDSIRLISAADKALYKAKQGGKNRVV